MAIPVLQLGPGGDYTTQYQAQGSSLVAVMPSGQPANEDRSAGQFARRQSQSRKRPPQTVSVHPKPISRDSDSYQPSTEHINTGTYTRPAPTATAANSQAALDQLLTLAPQQQQEALQLLQDALDRLTANPSSDASTAKAPTPVITVEDTERQRAIAHVLEDLRQLR
ncbi:MAG TPA: hypothetical protein DCM28_01325, partial [Phycisphaerales bacterium]|nr:hypothetical protein [Phycisphaerales bacterium]